MPAVGALPICSRAAWAEQCRVAATSLSVCSDMTSTMAAAMITVNKCVEQMMTPMKKPQDLQQTIAGRCTARAWNALKLLREHPAFPELIERLATIEGTLLNRDVEIALSKILKVRPLKH